MKKIILSLLMSCMMIPCVFAAPGIQIDDGYGNILGTAGNPIHVSGASSLPDISDITGVSVTIGVPTYFTGAGQGVIQLTGTSTGYTSLESGLTGTSNNTIFLPITPSDTLAALGTVETFTATQTINVMAPGSETIATATSVTPTGSYMTTYMANTQTSGTFTVNNMTTLPPDGTIWCLKMTSTAVQTFSWGNAYKGGNIGLPTGTDGSGNVQYFFFKMDGVNSHLDYVGGEGGYN